MAASNSRVYRDGAPLVEMADRGVIHGVSIVNVDSRQQKCYRYTAVPYALPPVGDRRFRKPVPLPNDFRYDHAGRTFERFGYICPQPNHFNFAAHIDADLPVPLAPPYKFDEDCLTLNIWVPARRPPPGGFAVFFFIHGGWLQVGNPHHDLVKDPSDLLASHEDGGKNMGAIFVSPGYRLNVFGFLAAECMPEGERGNFGFWDQRMALEWVVANIKNFGGDPDNITIGGLSAGAHSAHNQALYEFTRLRDRPDQKPLFRRIFLQSNAAIIPAKTIAEAELPAQELCRKLDIPTEGAITEKQLQALRRVDAGKLIGVLPQLHHHTFRGVRGPNEFVDPSWAHAMLDGDFARWCKRHGIRFMLGECENEENVYGLVNAPEGPDYAQDLERQLNSYYPLDAAHQLLQTYPLPSETDDKQVWSKTFGMIVADSQVYGAQRTLVSLLYEHGMGPEDVFRWQIAFRPRYLDRYMPAWMGVSHGFDDAFWWFARALLLEPYTGGSDADEFEGAMLLDTVRNWLLPFVMFVTGRPDVAKLWMGAKRKDPLAKEGMLVRRFTSDGQVVVTRDDRWQEKQPIMACMRTMLESSGLADAR